jgi:hypothetical protein
MSLESQSLWTQNPIEEFSSRVRSQNTPLLLLLLPKSGYRDALDQINRQKAQTNHVQKSIGELLCGRPGCHPGLPNKANVLAEIEEG